VAELENRVTAVEGRVEVLEEQVQSVDPDRPGLMMRVDRWQLVAKLLIVAASIGLLDQLVKIIGALFTARQAP
jgi:hypothetical protein